MTTISGQLLKTGVQLGYRAANTIKAVKPEKPIQQQEKVLRYLLQMAQQTQFGRAYGFEELLRSKQCTKEFRKRVPVFDYDSLYKTWWHQYQDNAVGAADVTWPGKVNYFALSSGTSTGTSKYIPETDDMLKTFRTTSMRLIFTLPEFHLPSHFWGTQILMIGGCTNLKKRNNFYMGDLSGISYNKLPKWFNHYYQPHKNITDIDDWFARLELIVEQAPNWNIGALVGIPSWISLMLQHIIDKYGLNTMHDIWPNLSVLVHGGIAFEPYRKVMEKQFGQKMIYIDTYFASEGSIAFQSRPDTHSLQMVLNNGMFFEFVPFNDQNFTPNGEMLPNAKTLLINEVEPGKDYALLLSTCAGAWRYLIGDTIRFTNVANAEIIVTGRTKHFLSLCGEHLSVDNMNHAIEDVETELNISIPEFAVCGVTEDNRYAHRWFIGTDAKDIDVPTLTRILDQKLKSLNDDYCTERESNILSHISVEIFPVSAFYSWMEKSGKMGGQHKFPRVLKGQALQTWLEHIDTL
ncbi:MAG TPA: GH3 auxin-responsive promoter family protein [Chitinophagales bacterium]|nr:GH3 auxin-responsive promoter family protein [Chitinophagales bacterium]HRK28682.1 GH3 auxin-responsive promoter family protein [Chitinophagales bacterium]